jgi:RNA polymerase sigma-70 factor (sigma-E family)
VRDSHGFDEFYEATRARLLTYLYAASGDLAEAQDAAQEAYTRAWQHWGNLRDSGDPEAWVRTVGWRVLSHRWRRLRNRQRAYQRHGPSPSVPAPCEDTVALVSALRRLPEPQRQAIVMHHLLDLPVAQIAAETGVGVGTLKARLSRGRAALADILGTHLQETENA